MLSQPEFGRRLRALRIQHSLSQAALADGEVSSGYLSRLESGARPPTARVVEYLARRLGVPTSALIEPEESAEAVASPASPFAQILAAVISATGDNQVAEPLADALRSDEKWDPALRWQAIWLLAQIRGNDGEREEQRKLLEELVELSGQLDAPRLKGRALTELSRCLRALGDLVEARKYALEASVTQSLSLTDRARVLQALVSAEAEMGQLAEARVHADELCALTDALGGTLAAEAQWASATVGIREGDYAGALARLERALEHADGRQDLILWMRLHLATASLCLQMTPPLMTRARSALDTVAPVISLVGTELYQQELQSLQATLAFEEGRWDEAWGICESVDAQRSLLSFRDRIKLAALRARLMILRGDRDKGIAQLQQLAQEAQQSHNVELTADVWRGLAETLATTQSGPQRHGGG